MTDETIAFVPDIFWGITTHGDNMQKTILTIVFLFAFVCAGATAASAKNSSLTERSATVTKNLVKYRAIALSFGSRCNSGVLVPCQEELNALIAINTIYEAACGPTYPWGCEPELQRQLLEAWAAYENCIEQNSKKIDKNFDRNRNRLENARA